MALRGTVVVAGVVLSTLLISTTALANGAVLNIETQEGRASYYADRFQGRTTASGDTFDQRALTAAHRSLPFGTKVLVTREDTGESVEVEINDRGPFVKGRIIDLSKGAARELGMLNRGVAPVRLTYLP
nr:septal ring lytic transglycosylase RlpA family protein [Halomonas cupida]